MTSSGVVLLVNYGGVPRTLHSRVLASHAWATASTDRVLLPHTRSQPALRACLHAAALWRLRRAGMRTVLVGATGIDDARDVAAPSDRLADPTARLERDWGIDVCPVHASYPDVWCAGVHDERALQEAADALARHTGDTPLFVCVHLLGCRDVARVRFGATGETGVMRTTADEAVDARIAPLTVEARHTAVVAPHPTTQAEHRSEGTY